MLAMSRQKRFRWLKAAALAVLLAGPAIGRVKLSKLAEELLYGDESTRMNAVNTFNHLPTDAQQKLAPDFMVAMSEDDLNTRKIAARILKAMGVKVETQIPDAHNEMKATPEKPSSNDPWEEEKKMKADSAKDKWGDLKKMRTEENGSYDSLKGELEKEKKESAWLDAKDLTSDRSSNVSPLSAVRESLKDPNPWVRAQAARQIGTLRPAPVDAIPELIAMMGENIPESRRAAAAALGSFGPLATSAIPVLTTALSDPDPATKQIAQEALKQIQARP